MSSIRIFSSFLFFSLLLFSSLQLTPPPPNNINHLLYWGTYKPHLISAVTQKSKYPITLGLAFSKYLSSVPTREDFKNILRFRVRPEMLAQYSHHNGLDLAIQSVTDKELGIQYDISFLEDVIQVKTSPELNELMTDWIYLIEASKIEQSAENNLADSIKGINTFIYMGLGDLVGREQDDTEIEVIEESNLSSTLLHVRDLTKKISKGYIRISVIDENNSSSFNSNIYEVTRCSVNTVPKSDTWKVEDIIYSHLTENELDEIAYLSPARCQNKDNVNFFLKQLISNRNFKIIVSYNPHNIPTQLTEKQVKEKIEKRKNEFEQEFYRKFSIENVNKFKVNISEAYEISRYALSNLLGGILYSFGKIRVTKTQNQTQESIGEELFTATPSRIGFPRGFLWDEGFHQSLICEWNTSLCIQMMTSWFNSIQADGWIPREQARGDELESNFKQKDFLYQSQQEANPPSMILPITKLLTKLFKLDVMDPDAFEIYQFLDGVLPRLKLWFQWLVRTQLNSNPLDGGDKEFFVRWVCKAPCNGKYFASGLDDYPRHPEKYHTIAQLDLHVWLATLLRGILALESLFQKNNTENEKLYQVLMNTLEQFYDTADNLPKDLIGLAGSRGEPNNRYRLSNLGYINLFPLFFGYEKDPKRIDAVIKLITAKEHLWSDFGVRSLSKSDSFFMKGDNYWTEPIWIPMNYLLLRGLKIFYSDNENARELYEALRENLMENFSENWKRTHNFWENYDSFSGKGKGFSSFTGWTSIIALICSEKFD